MRTIYVRLTHTNPIEQKNMTEPEKTSNTLAICALVFAFVCSLVGLVLGIIGITKYPKGSNGRLMSIIALIISALSLFGGIAVALSNS